MDIDFDSLGIELDDETRSKIAEAAKEQHERETQGLKAKRDELLETQRKLKDQMKQYEGIDPERARELEQEAERLREQQLQKEGKEDELFKLRMDRETAPLKSQLEQREAELDKYRQQVESLSEVTIQSGITAAAQQAGLAPTAIEDAQLVAKHAGWQVEDGTPILRTKDGEVVRGKDGPITFGEWLQTQRETRPHWFPQPKGSGAPGNRGGKAAETGKLDGGKSDRAAYFRSKFNLDS